MQEHVCHHDGFDLVESNAEIRDRSRHRCRAHASPNHDVFFRKLSSPYLHAYPLALDRRCRLDGIARVDVKAMQPGSAHT